MAWKNFMASELIGLVAQKKLIPVDIRATKDEVWLVISRFFQEIPNRDFLLHETAIQFRDTFRLSMERIERGAPVVVSGNCLGHFVRFEWNEHGLKLSDRTPKPVLHPPPPGLERNKNKDYPFGNSVSRQMLRWYRQLLKIWCLEDVPPFGRGRILKLQHGSPGSRGRERRRLIVPVREKMEKSKIRIFNEIRLMHDMP